MKRLILLALLIIGFLSVSAQEKYTAYADLLGRYKGDFSMKVKARVDFGQNVSFWKQGEMKIVDENGKEMVFNSIDRCHEFHGQTRMEVDTDLCRKRLIRNRSPLDSRKRGIE